jgi:lipopolysaccharide assembly protein A
MRLLSWLLRAFIFFTLFAFALNNLQPVTLHWFFGVTWTTPMVIVVLAAFAAGCVIGVIAMVSRAWPFARRGVAPSAPSAPSAIPPQGEAP